MRPDTREESFLGRIAGDENAENLEPRIRKEYYLKQIAENCRAADEALEDLNAVKTAVIHFTVTGDSSDPSVSNAMVNKTFEELAEIRRSGQPAIVTLWDEDEVGGRYSYQTAALKWTSTATEDDRQMITLLAVYHMIDDPLDPADGFEWIRFYYRSDGQTSLVRVDRSEV